METGNKAVQVVDETIPRYRLEKEGQYGWYAIIRRDGTYKPLLFKSIDDALQTRAKMGLPLKHCRVIDTIKCRRVL